MATTSVTPGFRLRGRAHKVALTAHIITSVGWFGIAVVIAFLAIAAAATADPLLTRALSRTLEITPWLSVPTGVLAFGTGALLSLGTTWGLVRHWWVVAKIAIATAVIVTDVVLFLPAAHKAAAAGSGELLGPAIGHCVVLAIATVLSVFKPRARTTWGTRVLTRRERVPAG